MGNLYEAPKAEIAPEGSEKEGQFYVVSKRKFWVLFLATAGLYGIYWFYRHWSEYKKATGEKMWPIARAWFSIFFTHRLFSLFESGAVVSGARSGHSLTGTATLFVLLTIAENVFSRLSSKSIGSPYTDIFGIVVTPLIGLLAWKAQVVANIACGDPEGVGNSKFSAANWVWIFIGVIFWLLIALGLAGEFGFFLFDEPLESY